MNHIPGHGLTMSPTMHCSPRDRSAASSVCQCGPENQGEGPVCRGPVPLREEVLNSPCAAFSSPLQCLQLINRKGHNTHVWFGNRSLRQPGVAQQSSGTETLARRRHRCWLPVHSASRSIASPHQLPSSEEKPLELLAQSPLSNADSWGWGGLFVLSALLFLT